MKPQEEHVVGLLMEEFRAGVTACLRSWSALRTAVESGWGGPESSVKAEDLRRNILECMDGSSCPPKKITIDDLEDNLAIYMEEEFSVVLEDNSEKQVADMIWRMYEECCKGNSSLAEQMVLMAESAIASVATYPVKIQSMEEDDDDDDDAQSMMDTVEDDEASSPIPVRAPVALHLPSASDYAAQPLFGTSKKTKNIEKEQPVRQLGEAIETSRVEEVDEDGFISVKPKGRKSRNE